MEIKRRTYEHASDYARVGEFLVRTYSSAGDRINWLQPRWEYMHYHPLIRGVDIASIGVWEVQGRIVAVVHPEHRMGTAYFEIDPAYGALTGEMLEYAEEHLCAVTDGGRALRIFINDRDDRFQKVAAEMGYTKQDGAEAMSHFIIPDLFPAISLPSGFRLKSLAEDNDIRKLHRVLWRGFDHGDVPPDDGIEERKLW